ncbi:hypothetical protein MN116_004278 [Schistosoma mekongi]|uniref:Uncharacterized protein n=1 Tax=Schistosoma mekongi TaxID=38744 RepID=A0AAE1ZFH2_SCHME|nr:hypothetical protein MN116_004278 [Schistosoma mekongi]
MYIESSGGYGKRWGGRSHTSTSYYTDTTGNQWSGASLKNKTRKTLVNQPQSVPQLSPITYLSQQQQQQLDFCSLNGSLSLTNHPSLKHAASFACSGHRQELMVGGGEWTDDLQGKSITEIQTAQTSLDLLYMPHLSTRTTINSNNNTITNTTTTTTAVDSTYNNNYSSINTVCCYNGPKESNSLSKDIAYKIKEKFDQRALKHLSKSKQKTNSNNYTYTSQYHLLAVFLVNKGHVEAWYAYAPMPNTFNNNEFGHTRLLELTQRRLRLLQRYYSDSRQYVVLYVNNNNSEHYLPMGLVNDTNKQHRNYHLSLSNELFNDRNGTICRFINSLLPNTMKFINTNKNNNGQTLLVNKQVNNTNPKDINEKLINNTDENHKLHNQQQKRRQEQQQQQQSVDNQNETKQLCKTMNSTIHRPNILKRIFGRLTHHHHHHHHSSGNNTNNSNNNVINIDKEKCTEITNKLCNLNYYETHLTIDKCLMRTNSHQQSITTGYVKKDETKEESITSQQTTTMKLDIPTSTCTNNSYTNPDNNNNQNIVNKDCFTASIPMKTITDDMSNRQKVCCNNRLCHINDDNDDDNEKCKFEQMNKSSIYEEIWLPKSFDL